MARAPHRVDGGVRFRFEGEARDSVHLAGTFNFWSGSACAMARDAAGWEVTLPLAPGRHLYKFVVDGRDWIPDPSNPWLAEDGQNNSSLTVDERGDVLIRTGDANALAPGDLYRRHVALASPAWLRSAVLYQLDIRSIGPTFRAARAHLDYLDDLGVNTIWMMPIHPIGAQGRTGSVGDPYAVRDMLSIDPALGDEADLRAFIDDVHARGMRILMDWTLNRTSADCRLAQLRPDWFTRDAQGRPYYAVPNRDYFIGFDFANRELREFLTCTMLLWIERFGFDGLRFDDSDITPVDFLDEIRTALMDVRPDIVLLSQAYDEFHHLAACDLTYDGGLRDALLAMRAGAGSQTLRRYWEDATYNFPRNALRMRWLDDKEQDRIFRHLGLDAHRAAATLQMTLDGVPHILMGQEYNEPRWKTWSVLFDGFTPERSGFDHETQAHYRALIALRRARPELTHGEVVFTDAPDLVMFRRGDKLVVCVNCSDQPVALPMETRDLQPLYAQGLQDRVLAPWGSLISAQ